MYDVIIVGGGAAGFYGAIHIAEASPNFRIALFERGKTVLSKVKISGGGRCNVTHAEYDPKELTTNYPRGEKELLGPFHRYGVSDTMSFFEDRGVPLKQEADGRVFPSSNSSQSIVDCLYNEAVKLGVEVLKNSSVKTISELEDASGWQVTTMNKHYNTRKLLLATGNNPKIWNLLQNLGHTIVSPVPSLFTFNITDERIKGLAGISTHAEIQIHSKKQYNSKIVVPLKSAVKTEPLFSAEGPLLITHWGLSGPAVLKLSAWGATVLNEYHYNFKTTVNWIPDYLPTTVAQYLLEVKGVESRKTVYKMNPFKIPNRLWNRLVAAAAISQETRWADTNKAQLAELSAQLTKCSFRVEGKSTFKEEFVTAGGVDLREIDFKTFKSRLLPNLYFAGEIINVDALTGGFNFQNAWTGSYLAAQAITADK